MKKLKKIKRQKVKEKRTRIKKKCKKKSDNDQRLFEKKLPKALTHDVF